VSFLVFTNQGFITDLKVKVCEPATYERDRCVLLGAPLLWSGADDRLSEPRPRVPCQCEEDKTALQAHGAADHIQKTQDYHKGRGQLQIPLSTQGSEDRAPRLGMADRYHCNRLSKILYLER
jgi:hypothetical protein